MSKPTSSEPTATATPKAAVRGIAWVVSRSLLGLAVMFIVTGIAALIAHASIEGSDLTVDELIIGTPAGALLARQAAAPAR